MVNRRVKVCIHGHGEYSKRDCPECGRIRDRKRYQNPERKQYCVDKASQWNKEHPEAFRIQREKQERKPKNKFRRLRYKASGKGLAVTLSFPEYLVLITPDKCHYCSGKLSPLGYSIDRLDNREGYTQSNSVACCSDCNSRKGAIEMAGFVYPRTVELLKELLANAALERLSA